ncbi:MAG: hypothetical protein MZU95_17560 [Desulfomicrobium escambiense]|nr:hypothetical protein [Desulfomicrobium escambiense]
MEDIFNYPHMPYWFTVRQGMDMMKKSIPGEGSDIATISPGPRFRRKVQPPWKRLHQRHHHRARTGRHEATFTRSPPFSRSPTSCPPPTGTHSSAMPPMDWRTVPSVT